MRLFLTFPLLITACSFDGAKGQGTGSDEDPMADAGPDAPQACVPGFLDLCGQPEPTANFIVGDVQINTDSDNRCRTLTQSGGPDVCLMSFTEVEVQSGGTFFAYGSRPLALVAATSIKIIGNLDVSSRRGRISQPGAGSAPSEAGFCGFATTPADDGGGGGAGAGGTFLSLGGVGGNGDTDGGAAAGGTPGPVHSTSPKVLRGGCNGQAGGTGREAPGGPGGLGGGAVYLAAPLIQITGVVYAGGSGAPRAGRDDGGGGGGSGGMVVMQSPRFELAGSTVIANGAGGGQGGDGSTDGDFGDDASLLTAAAGGSNADGGGNGGAGSTATTAAGMLGSSDAAGAGGGGGGAGFILLLGAATNTTGAMISPAAVERAR